MGEEKRPFSRFATEESPFPLEMPLVKSNRVLGLGVNEPGLIKRALVADPTNLFGERIGDPPFLRPNDATADGFVAGE